MTKNLFSPATKYVIDTSSIIDMFLIYPPQREVFKPLWEKFNRAVSDELIISSRYVKKELEREEADNVLDWAIKNKHIFKNFTPQEAAFIPQIQKKYPNLIKWDSDNIGADPWVVAIGKIQGICVITEEKRKLNAHKIPNVCDGFGITCVNLLQLFEREKW